MNSKKWYATLFCSLAISSILMVLVAIFVDDPDFLLLLIFLSEGIFLSVLGFVHAEHNNTSKKEKNEYIEEQVFIHEIEEMFEEEEKERDDYWSKFDKDHK